MPGGGVVPAMCKAVGVADGAEGICEKREDSGKRRMSGNMREENEGDEPGDKGRVKAEKRIVK